MLRTSKLSRSQHGQEQPARRRHRIGAVKGRSQTQAASGDWKRDTSTGRFMDVKTSSPAAFKGGLREKKGG